jgi:hypothetical protein
MDEVLKSLPLYMMIGIVIVIGISQFSRLLGGVLGVLFWLVVAIVGSFAYDQGGGIGVPGFKFPREMFYMICIVLACIHGLAAYTAWSRKARGSRRPPPVDDARADE